MGEDGDTPVAALERLLEIERRRNDHLMGHIGWVLARIDMRLTAIEAGLASTLSPAQLFKAVIGLALPILVLILTGNVDTARKLMGL